jgi:hypothetical protein
MEMMEKGLQSIEGKIKWLRKSVKDGDYYSQFLLLHLIKVRDESFNRRRSL